MSYCDDLDELRAQEPNERRYRNQLRAHPHPQDPDFPGDDDEDEPDARICLGCGGCKQADGVLACGH